eukprot:3406958-Prymnesium_polylepis.1
MGKETSLDMWARRKTTSLWREVFGSPPFLEFTDNNSAENAAGFLPVVDAVQSALLSAGSRLTDRGLATGPTHEIDLTVCGSIGCRIDV